MICPKCSKDLNDHFEYCNECGCKVDGSIMGDFKTEYCFVFKHPESYIFLNAKNGRQVVLRAQTLGDLEMEVRKNGFFWIPRDKKEAVEDVHVLDSKDVFIPQAPIKKEVSRQDSKDIFIPASSLKREKGVSKKPEKVERPSSEIRPAAVRVPMKKAYEPFKITDRHVKRNPNVIFKDDEEAEEALIQDYGILGVFKDTTQSAPTWVYKPFDLDVTITERTLERLKNKVESKGFKWLVVDYNLAEESFKKDLAEIRRRDEEIKAKNQGLSDVDFEMKSRLNRYSLKKKSNENSTELDRMHR